ncbi:efflux RND transporter periplasmic adaptor subunit [Rhodohalobacter sp. 614A]|uniref:efflux RND transporter periplasmic adaptor subunit n=1 Tax=Rhodohalobacter sp. 614A TaxID=2908649 RepID=UPI001F42D61A|nr:efflux RND transporter periplasmic adaptor subunit [Rhodohalobacter sp. 614A]
MDWKKTLFICLGILIAGAAITLLIFSTEPEATRSGAMKETAMLVDVVETERDTFTPTISAMGTVQPSQDIVLSPRVSGEITSLSENFTPGGYVEKGEVLLQIDPADYRNILQQRKSELMQAEADLNIEMGRQEVAKQDYELLNDSLTGANRNLILREPQLNAARSQVESARAAVEQAELNLQRTTIRAPFDAYILTRNVNIGSQVASGDELARLVGIDEYWIEAAVPQTSLRWITVPRNGGTGSPVTIRNRTAWEPDESREGTLFRLVGALENETRMARVLVSVPDPHGYLSGDTTQPRLMIGSFVETNIEAERLENVIRINRDYIRQDDTIWVMQNDSLDIRDVEIIFRDATYAYITEGLNDGEKIVTTNLSTVVDGSPLRLESADSATETASADTLSNSDM